MDSLRAQLAVAERNTTEAWNNLLLTGYWTPERHARLSHEYNMAADLRDTLRDLLGED